MMIDPENTYNPDVLSCLANLSNDEVFTSPKLANQILDLLPPEIWQDETVTFLDPATKSGVFLREINRRLLKGLANKIPDLQTRINHILTKQIFGIAITELTANLTRRTLYCSRFANGKRSVATNFSNEFGNILFLSTKHTWQNGKCTFCGANQQANDRDADLETHAYQFIHNNNPNNNMKFDVIIGNPPYQMSDGGAGASSIPLYHKFIEQAKKLNPKFLTMIIPARWYAGGKGLDEFRNEMLNDKRISHLVDFPKSEECFSNSVEIKGGVCYFLWQRDYNGKCQITNTRNGITNTATRFLQEDGAETLIRYNQAVSIIQKVKQFNEKSFADLVSSRKPFAFTTNFKDYSLKFDEKKVKIFANKEVGYVERNLIKQNIEIVDKYKVFITRAYGAGEDFPHQILNKPILGEPNSCCTETYIFIGPFENKQITENVINYISTKFFRFLVLMLKNTQDAPKKVYKFVPQQDFLESWNDEKLFKKYNLLLEEIEFINSMIKPMQFNYD